MGWKKLLSQEALVLSVHISRMLLLKRATKSMCVNPKAILHVLDIREKEKLIPMFEGVKYVFHEAALPKVQYSIENPIETNEVNIIGLLNVFRGI